MLRFSVGLRKLFSSDLNLSLNYQHVVTKFALRRSIWNVPEIKLTVLKGKFDRHRKTLTKIVLVLKCIITMLDLSCIPTALKKNVYRKDNNHFQVWWSILVKVIWISTLKLFNESVEEIAILEALAMDN